MINIKQATLAVICITSAHVNLAQTSRHPWAIGLDLNYKEYHGEFGNSFFKFRHFNLQPGVTVSRYLNPFWDAAISLNYGKFRADDYFEPLPAPLEYKGLMAGLSGRFKFNNGRWIKENALLGPYLTAGIGYHLGNKTTPTSPAFTFVSNTTFISAGVGVKVNLSPRLALNIQSQWMPSFTDKLDHHVTGERNDQLWEHRLGVVYQFGKGKTTEADSDNDGVANDKDRCPNTPEGTRVDKFGCPVVDDNANKEIATIVKGVYFKTGSAELEQESFAQLDKVVALMKKFDQARLIVEGHTDNTGSPETNQVLSQNRAEAVKRYIVSKGISASRITAKGYGETMPVKSNKTEEGRARNRRVEIILTR